MKIVLTVHQFLPEFSAGTEILTYETAMDLISRGHEVTIFTGFPVSSLLNDQERFDEYVFNGIRVYRFKHSPVAMGSQSNIQELEYNNFLFGSYFKDHLLQERPDIVHFFHLARLSASAINVCRELGIPTVLTPTDFWFICPTAQLRLMDNSLCSGPDQHSLNCFRHVLDLSRTSNTPQRWFLKLPNWVLVVYLSLIRFGYMPDRLFKPWMQPFLRRASFLKKRINQIDRVALPTHVMGKLLVQNGLESGRTFHLPFGLNPAYSDVERVSTHDVLRLGYIGTLAEYKGVHILIQAIKLLPGMPLELKIYGKQDDYPEYVKSLIEIADGDSRIEFCGTFPNPKIGEIFSNLDALVVPSLWYENSPLVVYSAQSARCPVIASNMEGMSEVIEHDRNGLLFEAGNVMELAAAIKKLLENRELLDRFSKNAKVPLTIQGYVDRLLNVYTELTLESGNL